MSGYIIYNENGSIEDILPLTYDECVEFLEKNPGFYLEELELDDCFEEDDYSDDDYDDINLEDF